MPLIFSETKRYKELLLSYRLSALKEYQCRWVKETRDQRILNRGKDEALALENDVSTQSLALIMPESARIATMMSCTEALSFERMLLFVEDLRKHCARDFDVVYLPRENPVQGCCPLKECRKLISSVPKTERSTHIHQCAQRKIATEFHVSEESLTYCYECMEWVLADNWTDHFQNHFQNHFQSWSTRHCEVITYRHTVIRPGYCPFCLWGIKVSAKSQSRYWLLNDKLRDHVEDQHIRDVHFPTTEPVCGCSEVFQNELDLRHHLHDIHGLNKSIWLKREMPKKRKRAIKSDGGIITAITDDEQDKKPRFSYLSSSSGSEIETSRDTSMPVDAWILSTMTVPTRTPTSHSPSPVHLHHEGLHSGTFAFIPYSFKLFESRNFVIMYDSKCQSRLSFFNIFPIDEGGRNDLGGRFKESRWLNREPNIRENP